jgi:hypothetical protein
MTLSLESDRRISLLMPLSRDERHTYVPPPPCLSPISDCFTRMIHKSTKMGYAKYLERQIVQVWKTLTDAARKPTRVSYVPRDFVLVTRRRSSLFV